MQSREQEQIQDNKLLEEAKYYLRSFGRTCIFESTSNDDLEYVGGEKSNMPPELYPLVVELANQSAAEFQKEVCEGLSYDDSEDTDDEPETPEEKQTRLEAVEEWKKMSPKEFWLMMFG